MRWLLFSDLAPLLGFAVLADPSLTLLAALATRACSLVFHLFGETRPHLIHLDHMGIACMCLASVEISRRLQMPLHNEYAFVLFTLALAAQALFAFGLLMRRPPADRVVLALAALGHIPTAYALATAHPCAPSLAAAAALFGVGYFAVEPRSHIAWHWVASAGQAVLLLK